jgi:DNA-binding MarR family transcriptional regulator
MKTNSGSNQDRMTHLGRLLLELSKDFVASSNDYMKAKGYDFVRATHIRVLSQIKNEGSDLSDLIKKVGLSKQAINKVIRQLEELDIISTQISDKDARARVVRFTPKGRRFLDVGLEVIEVLEKEYRDVLGRTDYLHLKASLEKIATARGALSRNYNSDDE